MENLENIFYSILPLIVIIVISWLFSSMGSRLKKQTPSVGGEPEPTPSRRLIDLITEGVEPEVPPGQERGAEIPGQARPADAVGWPRRTGGGPTVSPKPITPKWWGA